MRFQTDALPKSEKNFGRSSKRYDAENFLKLIRGYVKGIIPHIPLDTPVLPAL
jgi:hypothetical protein